MMAESRISLPSDRGPVRACTTRSWAGHGDGSGLHAAHGEAGHGAMRLIGDGAEVGVDVGDQVVDEKVLECAEVEADRKSIDDGIHAAHGGAGHGAMRLIGDGAEVGVDVGDQVVDEKVLECAEVEAASAWPAATGAGRSEERRVG